MAGAERAIAFKIPCLEIEKACCDVFEVELDRLKDGSKSTGRLGLATFTCYFMLRHIKLQPNCEIACRFDKTPPVVTQGIKKLCEKARKDDFVMQSIRQIGLKINASAYVEGLIKNHIANG